ncbi:MAG: hypothetical protein AAGF66_06030 [Cyanobacteria bacterium P01_H01_bin.119]
MRTQPKLCNAGNSNAGNALSHSFWATGLVCGAAIAAATLNISTAQAQTCVPLQVVEGQGTEVSKTVSPPGLFVVQSNWNTDFVVPEDGNFTEFIATITANNGTTYDVDVTLKYRNDTADTPYSRRSLELTESVPFDIAVPSRVDEDPYQVNLRVGGLVAEGNSYTASVVGCL